ncbi:MAG TPA: excinuclease ABC subunit UvrC [Verrucomicrobiae bacterium]|nr:excinuclease ABC subunit UvrC [Verrucomicrobiae bacterium]
MPDPKSTPETTQAGTRDAAFDIDSPNESGGEPTRLQRGVEVISAQLKNLPSGPGVYRMLNDKGDPLYVGKARSLRKRVGTYTQIDRLANRLQRMVAETTTLEVIATHTEVEALLLESNLIKRLAPRYNVQLRDDKSFPYILIARDHAAPQILKHRGARDRRGEYFGPFASAGAVNNTITALQRAFLLRSCSDAVYASRTRPCLQYQIKRCSAPCVGRITDAEYGRLVDEAGDFLSGHSREVQDRLAKEMQAASDALEFERAARLRDRVRALAQIQSHQGVNVAGLDEADIIAAHQAGGQTCVQVFFFRGGSNYGNRAYFPSHDREMEIPQVLSSFIGQFYDNKEPPKLVLVSHTPLESALLQEALSVKAGRKVELIAPRQGGKRKLIDQALLNAREALERRLAENATQRQLLEGVAQCFGLENAPQRIEVYDNSHISGRNAYGAMIVAGPDGFQKNAYRKFSIDPEGLTPGDDYAMMRQVLTRRFSRALKEDPERDKGTWPDLVLVDGGAGQLGVALEVFAELGVTDVALVGVAKGPDRDAGRERFFMPGREPFGLEPRDPVLYFLQRLRDEAHRFAIGAHRNKRSAQISQSPLDEIPGIGAKRKKALLHRFGSAKAVARAGLEDLQTVDGISAAVAKKIYDYFNSSS